MGPLCIAASRMRMGAVFDKPNWTNLQNWTKSGTLWWSQFMSCVSKRPSLARGLIWIFSSCQLENSNLEFPVSFGANVGTFLHSQVFQNFSPGWNWKRFFLEWWDKGKKGELHFKVLHFFQMLQKFCFSLRIFNARIY